ncbi:protein Smaug homolog 1-like isoform X1 [Amphiura filiformis]|uniref:protein Smaug homolog 1-like isoform X1 n=1 Tax=Amphiura filiformis TaxID=82378 RepID=UPI003B222EFF
MMKPTYRFRDQVNYLSAWFKEWNDCEQTVALYSLLKRVSGPQAKFLTLVLEQTLSDSEEWSRLELEANDPAYLSSLCNESIESAVSQLLNHLPFLTPGSNDAKAEYLSLIPKILTHSVEKGLHLEDSRQLLSYLLIHPALTNEERSSLAWWLGRLEEQTNAIGPYGTKPLLDPSPMPSPFPGDGLPSRNGLGSKPNGWRNAHHKSRDSYNESTSSMLNQLSTGPPLPHQPLTYTLSAPPAVNVTGPSNDPIGSTAGLNLPPHHRSRRSNSLTPPDSSSALSFSPQPYGLDWPSSPEDLEIRGNRSLSLPNEHAPLSPQSSTASSNSSTETHPEDGMPYGHPPLQKRNSFLEENSGMRDVPTWLKSLRLHKYQGLFQQMSYDEMMTLTEQDLERMNVTKGARHKIVLSVQKLRERQILLQNLEKDIMSDGSPGVLRNALNHIKNIIITPIKPYGSTGIPDSSSMATAGFGQGLPPESTTESDQGSGAIQEGDLPAQITRFMGKMCTQLLVSRRPDEDNISLYLQLLDKSLNHESFTATQKKRLYSWRQSCQKFSRNPFPRKLSLQETKQTRPWGHYGTNFPPEYAMFPASSVAAVAAAGGARRLARPSFSTLTQSRINPLLVGATTNQPGVFRPTQSSSMYVKPRPLQGNAHATVTRTKSAPIRRTSHPAGNPSPFGVQPPSQLDSQFVGEPEIMNRTESLCLSVTELALGDMDQMTETQRH